MTLEDSVVESAPSSSMKTTSGTTAYGGSKASRAASVPADLHLDPCLFYSYTASCAKGEGCEYSHSIHADQVAAPEAKQRRGQARFRIKKRLNEHFAVQNVYEVHQALQLEARKDNYAKQLIRRHLIGSDASASAIWATSATSGASASTALTLRTAKSAWL